MELWELHAREAIRDTIATYNYAGDAMRLADLAGCFAEDGVLELRGRPPAVGRSAIRAVLEGLVQESTDPAQGAKRYVHHHVSSIHFISIVPSFAQTRSYFEVLTVAGLDHWGRYEDTFVPADDKWLLQHRKATMDGHIPGSRFGAH